VCPGTFITGFVPSAAVATITVTGQGGNGNLIVWQGTSPVASASTMSYPASGDTSSLATIPEGGRAGTGPGGAVQDFGVFVNAFTATNVVVDIVGYYTQPAATALDCVTTAENIATMNVSTGVANPGFFNSVTAPACGAGYTETATYCRGGFVNDWIAVVGSFGTCYGNTNDNTHTISASKRCCRVPGH
jgi:hypothetical protein